MLLKVIAGLLVAVAVALTGMALVHNGHCPFSHGCCDTGAAPAPDEAAASCCTPASDCCSTTGTITLDCCTGETAAKKADCCEESKVAGEDKK
jgi:hypothetical protein